MKQGIIFCIFLLSVHVPVHSRPVLNFPNGIRISVNDSIYIVHETFRDSLTELYESNRFLYHIAAVHNTGAWVSTILRLPQTLGKTDVIKQVILYYNFLPDENTRRAEHLKVFPFFMSLKEPAPVVCYYKGNGLFDIKLTSWKKVPIPPPPSPEDREIYNQIMNRMLDGSGTLDEVHDTTLKEVAIRNDMPLYKIRKIYRDVLLWQRSQ